MFVWSWLTIFIATLVGVELFRRWSLRRSLLDVPNERSSHTRPTPRGGGLVIVALTTLACMVFSFVEGNHRFLPYLGAAFVIAIVSFIDDIRPLSPLIRIVAHSFAAGFAVYLSGGIHSIELPFAGNLRFGATAMPVAFLFVVWLTNAYNFMDGIDGIAALQAIIGGISWAAAGILFDLPVVAFVGGTIAATNAGFLIHNWQPAKIFMGDVGSAFLGFLFAVIPLYAAQNAPANDGRINLLGIVFVWFFLFDTVVTILRRALKREKIWQAHRLHIYQRLVQGGLSHASVTTVYGSLAAIFALVALAAPAFSRGSDTWIALTGIIETVTLLAIFMIRRKRPHGV